LLGFCSRIDGRLDHHCRPNEHCGPDYVSGSGLGRVTCFGQNNPLWDKSSPKYLIECREEQLYQDRGSQAQQSELRHFPRPDQERAVPQVLGAAHGGRRHQPSGRGREPRLPPAGKLHSIRRGHPPASRRGPGIAAAADQHGIPGKPGHPSLSRDSERGYRIPVHCPAVPSCCVRTGVPELDSLKQELSIQSEACGLREENFRFLFSRNKRIFLIKLAT
jgi:hypothetical protein